MEQQSIPTVQQEIDHLTKTKQRIATVIKELEQAKAMLHKTREHRHQVDPKLFEDLGASDDKVAEVERQLDSVFSRMRIKAIESLIELCENKSSTLITEINKLKKQLKKENVTSKNQAANEGEIKQKRKAK